MTDLTDEILMAYADGELDPASNAEVEATLRKDPAAGRRLEIFLATGVPVADFFAPLLEEPIPDHLVRLVKNNGKLKQRRGSVLSFMSLAKSTGPFGASWPTMVAASLVTVVAITALTMQLYRAGGNRTELVIARHGEIFAQGPLKKTLETAPSGTKVSFDGETSAMSAEMILTFRNRKQLFCRQYEVSGLTNGYSGIACRDKDGEWRVKIHIAASSHPHHGEGEQIVPAGRTASDVEAAVNKVMDGDALGRDEERTLIERNWQPSR